MSIPAIPESLKGQEKKVLDVVFAAGPGGKIYSIPTSVAEQYEFKGEHAPIPSLDAMAKQPNPGSDEVQGHHAVILADGSYGYHANWLYGEYIWHVNGRACIGPHYHPFGWTNPLAADQDG